MKRRLQQMQEGTEKDNPLKEQTTTENNSVKNNENQNKNEEFDENKKTNFRFPIVSDYEIYGWEPQIHHDEYTKDYLQKDVAEEDIYEILPLEQNERWPGRFERSGNVYRAEAKRDFAHIIPPTSNPLPLPFSGRKHERTLHTEPQRIEPYESQRPELEETSRQKEEPVKVEKPKKFRKPFSPTHVPSPIYGLHTSSPISEAMESVIEKKDTKDQELHDQLENHDEELPLSLISNQQSNETPLFASSSEKRQSEMSSAKEHSQKVEESKSEGSEEANQLVEQTEEIPVIQEEPVEVAEHDYVLDEIEGTEETEEAIVELEAAVTIVEPEESQEVFAHTEDVEQTQLVTEVETEVEKHDDDATEPEEIAVDSEAPVTVTVEEEIEEVVEEEVELEAAVPILEPEESQEVFAHTEDVERTQLVTEVETEVEKHDDDATEPEEIAVDSEAPVTVTVEEEIEEIEEVEEEIEVIESDEVESEIDDIEEQAQPVKKEKVVPFNVLMLKSDKEKLAARVEELIAANAAKKEIVVEEPIEIESDHTHNMAEQTEAVEDIQPVLQEQQKNSVEASMEELASIKEPVSIAVESDVEVTEVVATTSETIVEEPEEEIIEEELPHYGFPTMHYLAPPEEEIVDEEWLASQSATLEETLSHFSVQASVVQAVQGPAVTMFELTVKQGTKVSKIRNLTDDLKLALAARDIRIQAPIPGTSMIGIEIPNRKTRAVRISEVIDSDPFMNSDSPLEAVLGLSLTGEPQTIDLRKMPHGMIAGATGSGKSVCINSILISLLYKASHHDLKLLLIDPKMVELAPYNGIPHLLSPVITDVKAATGALKWAVNEMERRYELFAHSGVRNIERYNEMVMESRRFSLKMPYILVVIDELADLMMMAPADVEVSISRITQKARACGIHLIIATQRPSVDVITGTIKANIPTRIAFAVSSQVDSRTILDSVGADRLLGKGDMLYLGNGQSAPVRLQGTFVTDDEIERIIEHVRNEAEPNYLFGQDDLLAAAVREEESDPLFEQACNFVIEQGSASTSSLQRHFSIGYNRAAKLIDRMEANQFISEQRGSKARDVFLTEQAFESFMK
ncbi:DNA translocase FtsK [Sporosarcina ureae]|uniref:DNA translocase FtsK n=1 Tax=Sporosarcina ureae TaxID=1571 RepID=UPI0028AB2475|nr:DNA translocase FtsK [Sporosarcina ureae]